MYLLSTSKQFLILLMAVAILSLTSMAWAESEHRYITVTGKGEVSAAPDTVWITSGVNTQAPTAAQALDDNNELMQDMLDVFKDADIEEKNIQTSGFNVSPIYDYSTNSSPPKLTGYQVNNSMTAKLTQLDKLGELLDEIVSAGSNQISGIRFGFNDDEELLDQARKYAMANAMKKAQLYAKEADAKVGEIVSISESSARLPTPVYQRAEMPQAKMMDAGSVPIMKGEQALSTTITVVYELEN